MSRNRGIRVPENPGVAHMEYRDSTVTEYYPTKREVDERYQQLLRLKRKPTVYFTTNHPYLVGQHWVVKWTEPRGPELAALGEQV